MSHEIIQSDVLTALRAMPDASFDACMTDPPYGLGTHEPSPEEILAYLSGGELAHGGDFMGKDWQLPSVAVWRELRRVLRPGAHVFAFGGTRMFDLLIVGMRMAGLLTSADGKSNNRQGFGIRDTLCWLYGQGYAKSKRIERAISVHLCELPGRHFEVNLPKKLSKRKPGDHVCPIHPIGEPWIGWGTGMKPSYEPIAVARVPLEGTLAENVLKHGVGGLNIDGGRIGYASEADRKSMAAGVEAIRERGGVMNNSWKNSSDLSGANPAHQLGRWPPNVIISHMAECQVVGTRQVATGTAHRTNGGGKQFGSDADKPPLPDLGYADENGLEEVEDWECHPDCPVVELDRQSGNRPTSAPGTTAKVPKFSGLHYNGGKQSETPQNTWGYGDDGGASRFYYCPKADRSEREFGCENLPARSGAEAVDRDEDTDGVDNPRAGAGRTAKEVHNHHPTVKPIKLCKWGATLLLPKPLDRPRRILVIYSGSGSEMIGCLRAGWDEVVGVERDPEYIAIARARLERWTEVPETMVEGKAVSSARAEKKKVLGGQTSLF